MDKETPPGATPYEPAALLPAKRASHGCDECRRRHLRCSIGPPPCLQCRAADVECHFTVTGKKRGRPKRTNSAPSSQRSGTGDSTTLAVSATTAAAPSPSGTETETTVESAPSPPSASASASSKAPEAPPEELQLQLVKQPRVSPDVPDEMLPPPDLAWALLDRAIAGGPYSIAPFFRRKKFTARGPEMPPWLLWSVMAAGAAVSPDLDKSLGAPAGGWGQRLFHVATSSLNSVLGTLPSVPTLKSLIYLLLVSLMDPALHNAAYPLLNLALQMARDLHLDQTGRTAESSWTRKEEQLRCFWVLWGTDRVMAAIDGTTPFFSDGSPFPSGVFSPEALWDSAEDHPITELNPFPSSSSSSSSATEIRKGSTSSISSDSPAPVIDTLDSQVTDLPSGPSRQVAMCMLMWRSAALASYLTSAGLPQFGPGSETAQRHRRTINAALERWALAEELMPDSVPGTVVVTPSNVHDWAENRWFMWHISGAYLYSPRDVIKRMFQGEGTTQENLAIVLTWLQDQTAVEKCRFHVRHAAGWLAEVARRDPSNKQFSLMGFLGVSVAYFAMLWLVMGGDRRSGKDLPIVVHDSGVPLGRNTGPYVDDALTFKVLTNALGGIGQVWKICLSYKQGLEEVAESLGDLLLGSAASASASASAAGGGGSPGAAASIQSRDVAQAVINQVTRKPQSFTNRKMPPDKKQKGYRPSPEEIERIRAERAAAKAVPKPPEPPIQLHPRKLLPVSPSRTSNGLTRTSAFKFTVMTFNMLAQCLVRRDLFPFAPAACLRQKYRFERILQDLKERSPSLLAMQEVDNYESIVNPFLAPSYDSVYALKAKVNEVLASSEDVGGHGLLLAWKRDSWIKESYREIKFDGHQLTHPTPVRPKTANIAQMVALRSTEREDFGLIVGNVHAYWRPAAKYERARQIWVLLKEMLWFRETLDKKINWTTLVCGDWNTVPSSTLYRCLTHSDDFTIPETRKAALEELEPHITAYGNLGVDEPTPEDVSAYPPNPLPADKLLAELESLPVTLESAYGNYMDVDPNHTRDPRWEEGQGWKGEPVYSTYIAFYSGVLDYIFVAKDKDENPEEKKYTLTTTGLLGVPPVDVVAEGIPNDLFPSDHVSLMAEFTVEEK